MTECLRVLLIEADTTPVESMIRALQQGGFEPIWQCVDTREALQAALHDRSWDVIIFSSDQLQFTASQALELLRQQQLDLPFIVVSTTSTTADVIKLMKAGAHNYLERDQLASLATVVERELREATLRRDHQHAAAKLIDSEAKTRAILATIPDYLFCVDANGVYLEISSHHAEIALCPPDLDPIGLTMTDVLPAEVAALQMGYLAEALASQGLKTYEQCIQVGEHNRYEEVRVIQCGPAEALFMIRDISDRQQADIDLRASEARWQFALEGAGDGVWDWDLSTNAVFYSPQWKAMLGYGETELRNSKEEWAKRVHPDDWDACPGRSGVGRGCITSRLRCLTR
ncbi:MAG: PAS domain-containing protein, partial [Cyanobacteria bacterium P01_H01_bin.121]